MILRGFPPFLRKVPPDDANEFQSTDIFYRRLTVSEGIVTVRLESSSSSPLGRRAWHPSSVTIISRYCFSPFKLYSSAIFEFGSSLRRLELGAFASTALASIHIPASVEVIGKLCFDACFRLESVTFGPDSRLSQLEDGAFQLVHLTCLSLPGSVELIDRNLLLWLPALCFNRIRLNLTIDTNWAVRFCWL
jgi:hypothetical protein